MRMHNLKVHLNTNLFLSEPLMLEKIVTVSVKTRLYMTILRFLFGFDSTVLYKG